MHICDLTTLYIDHGEGGVNTYLFEKARHLAAQREQGSPVRHTIVVPGRRDTRRQLFGSTLITVKSPSLPSNPQHRVLARVKEVKRILRDLRPDIVEVDCAYLLGQVAKSALPQVPVVGFYHVHLPTFIARPRASRRGSKPAPAPPKKRFLYDF